MYLCGNFETFMDLLPFLHQKLIFTPADIAIEIGNIRSAETLLSRYQKQGYVSKIRRGLYCVNNIATGQPEATKFQIASSITPYSFVAYHAAMEYHGLAHQVYYDIKVSTTQQFNDFDFDGYHYTAYLTSNTIGVNQPLVDSHIRVTNIERTVADCIDRIDLCGGWEELTNCLKSIQYLHEELLLAVLHAYNKTALYKKVGFLLQTLALPVSKKFISTCQQYANRSVTYLTSDGDSQQFCQPWRLYVPGNILTINNTTTNEFV